MMGRRSDFVASGPANAGGFWSSVSQGHYELTLRHGSGCCLTPQRGNWTFLLVISHCHGKLHDEPNLRKGGLVLSLCLGYGPLRQGSCGRERA